MSKNPPDWWARVIGGLGLAIGAGGLALSCFSYGWQKTVYEKGQEERVLVELSAEYGLSDLLSSEWDKKNTPGQLAVEVVNLGMQPMYLKKVTGEIGRHSAVFYLHDPMRATEAMKKLEPGEAADYKINWQESSPERIGGDEGRGTIEVETTKKRFSQPAQVNRVNVWTRFLLLAPGARPSKEPPHPRRQP